MNNGVGANNGIGQTLIGLLTSQRFIIALIGLVAIVVEPFGIVFDPVEVAAAVVVIVGLIVGITLREPKL